MYGDSWTDAVRCARSRPGLRLCMQPTAITLWTYSTDLPKPTPSKRTTSNKPAQMIGTVTPQQSGQHPPSLMVQGRPVELRASVSAASALFHISSSPWRLEVGWELVENSWKRLKVRNGWNTVC